MQACNQDQFGGVQNPQNVDLLDLKSGLLNLTPLNLLQTPHFWLILWLKVDLLADLGVRHTLHPPGYGPVYMFHMHKLLQMDSCCRKQQDDISHTIIAAL